MTLAQVMALVRGSQPKNASRKPLTPAQRERLSRSPLMNSKVVVNGIG